MDRRGYGLGTWNGRIFLEDEVEAFGSLNVNFTFSLTLDSLKRDSGIHIAIGFSFLFNDLEKISSLVDF